MTLSTDGQERPQRFTDIVREQLRERREALSPPLSPRQREQRRQRDAERCAADESEQDT